MSQEGHSEGDGINSFDPSQVEVKNGYLYLKAKRSEISKNEIDCKNSYFDQRINAENMTNKCPIISGGVESRKNSLTNTFRGFEQAYGRFEVRAKLSKGAGSWPAIWMLAKYPVDTAIPFSSPGTTSCGWPYNGEIDMVETWSNNSNKVYSGYIHGRCDEKLQINKGFSKVHKDVTESFHLYAVEWTPNYIRFLHDNEIVGTIFNKEELDSDKGKREAWIPSDPFFWILNLTIEKGLGNKKKERVDIDNFREQELVIDYVKNYRQCTQSDPLEKCKKIQVKGDVVEKYNTKLSETATGEINLYPNPIFISQSSRVTLRITLHQHCKNVRIHLSTIDGKPLNDTNKILNQNLNSMNAKLDNYFEITLPIDTPAGTYVANSTFQNCGDNNGSGNLAYKFLIL
jgi:beta-glucanase (GH16 family)